jgi:hypothetical protein
MSASSDPQSLSSRLERLEQRCQKLGRQCRALKYALAVVFLVALITPVAVLVRTSLGSELRIDTLIADHIILPRRGELVVEGEKPGQPRARLGHFADDHWFGLALFEDEKPVVRLRGGAFPSLALQHKHKGESQLRLGYTGSVASAVADVVGEPMLELVGHDGARRASLSIVGNDPHFVLFDFAGLKPCVDISVAMFSRVTLRSPAAKEKQRGLRLSSFPKVELLDEEGRPMPQK